MELLDGIDLGRLTAQHGRLSIPDACELARQVAVGLDHIHSQGLVHRDIKPSNLMLVRTIDRPATVKILDLGLALFTREPFQLSGEVAGQGQIMGTLDYMAPEQALDSSTVDGRVDLYSLGSTLRKFLTGQSRFGEKRRPDGATNLAVLLQEPTPSIAPLRPDLPPALVELVDGLLASDPTQRPGSAAEVAARLAPFAAGHNLGSLVGTEGESPTDPVAVTANQPRRPGSGRRRTRLALAAGGLVVAALVVVAVILFRPSSDAVDDSGKGGLSGSGEKHELSGPKAYALEFDGQSSYVEIPTLSRGQGDEPFTLEAWARPDEASGNEAVVVVGGPARCQLSRNVARWEAIDFAQGMVFQRSAAKRTVHLAYCFDTQVIRFFVDGKLVKSKPGGTPPRFPGYYPIGYSWIGAQADRDGTGTCYGFKGLIAGARISTSARYETDFVPQQRHEPDKDTLALYHFDEGQGDRLTDASGHGHHGKIVGAKWCQP
jgi:hypothetical protein